ncbi:ferredoxin--NADP reductase [Stieleria marina]|uniref:ferredoxin--NADP(+) reductase n=1 Tax=Stieleria marina TaxID=1930275 RepID=A0A517NPJ1_9BACT|nr:Ferredoxin--NADP reductase [Planctomycetes bacterium K23_9]
MSEQIDSVPVSAEEAVRLSEQHYNATIVERIDHNDDLSRFRIRPDKGVPPFKPGQYVTLGLGNWEPRLEGTQVEVLPEKKWRRIAQRAYSISCPMIGTDGKVAPIDSVDYMEFYVTLVRRSDSPDKDPPSLTPRLFKIGAGDRLMIGKKITGHYTLGDSIGPDDTVLMLGTGTGEAPHNAMVATLLAGGHRGRIANVTTVRHKADLAYHKEHAILMEQYPQYRYVPYSTRDPENTDAAHPNYVGKRYLQELFTSGDLATAVEDPLSPTNSHVFLCGNPSMIGFVPPGGDPPANPGMLPLLREAGFSDDSDCSGPGCIRFEKYW